MDINGQAATMVASARRLAIAAGVCFLITHVTAVGPPALYGPVLTDAGFIVGAGPDTGVLLGALFEIILAIAIIGTAVALFPVVKRWHEDIALGYVGLRTLEGAIIAVGVLPLLALVTLRQQLVGGTDTATLATLGSALVALHNWTVILGPGLVCGVNTVLLASLLYRSGLVPRIIPVLGLVGGPLVFAYNTGLLFGVSQQIAAWAVILVLPIFSWEVSLALWMIIKGFKPAAFDPKPVMAETREVLSAA